MSSGRRWWLWLISALLGLAAALLPVLPGAGQGGATPTATAGNTHVVAWGETLTGLAWRYGIPLATLAEANGLSISSQLLVGQRLVIPAAAASPTPQATATSSPAPLVDQPSELELALYVVQPGDTLSAIATRLGLRAEDLAYANRITDPSLIRSGQALVVPAQALSGSAQPAATPTSTSEPPASAQPVATLPPLQVGPPPGGLTSYVVQKGDNLTSIAARFGVPLQSLLQANQVGDAGIIHPGQVLSIPPAPPVPAPVAPGEVPVPTISEGKQIVVVLSQQRLFAFEDGNLLQTFLVSTGLPGTPTVQGSFSIYDKVPAQRMWGPGYDLPNVQWVMYFYRDYSLHGAYWHNNFGQPMSHGCVNMRNEDAKWLYDWAPEGTSVMVIQ